MPNPFVPKKPEEILVVKITKREAILLTKLRKYAHGKFVVHKYENVLVRLEIMESQSIDETIKTDLLESMLE